MENDFPRGLNFAIEISSAHPVKEVELRFFLGTGRIVRLAKPELLKGVDTTNGSYFLRLTGNDYQPPGVVFNYWYVIEDVEGNVLETPRKTFPYLDNRFNWKELTEGPITVLYYGPVKSRAESVLQASVETNQRMGKTLELELETPLRVMMYNNVKDMINVIPFTSNLIRRTLITEGQAYANQGLMFVLGSDPLFRGVTSHEFTHILVGNATSPHTGLVPVWLTEGLAEYGNLEPGPSYGEALEKGIRTRTLFSVTELTGRPGTPDEIILLYGQSKSLVEFLVTTYSVDRQR